MPAAIRDLHERARLRGTISEQPIIVVPSEGSTGTTSIDVLARCCGLRTFKWNAEARKLASVDPRKYVDLDFTRILGNRYDIALDTPIQYTWPYIVAQFPNARILHLTRNGTEWVLGRSYLQQALRPFGWAFEPNTDPRRHVKAGNAHQFANADGVIDALTFHAAESFVRCSVLREKYQEVPTDRLCAMQETLRAQLNCSRASCLVPDCNASGTRVGRSQYSPVKFMARQALLDAWHQE